MSEIAKLSNAVNRVARWLEGNCRLVDLVDEVWEIKDTLEKIFSGKFAAIDLDRLIRMIAQQITHLNSILENLDVFMSIERELHDKMKVMIDLGNLKRHLQDLETLSFKAPVWFQKDLITKMRRNIQLNIKEVQTYIEEVKRWK